MLKSFLIRFFIISFLFLCYNKKENRCHAFKEIKKMYKEEEEKKRRNSSKSMNAWVSLKVVVSHPDNARVPRSSSSSLHSSFYFSQFEDNFSHYYKIFLPKCHFLLFFTSFKYPSINAFFHHQDYSRSKVSHHRNNNQAKIHCTFQVFFQRSCCRRRHA